MSLEITAIRKHNPQDSHEAVSHYGWRKQNNTTGIDTREDVISYLERNKEKAYVADGVVSKVWCDIRDNGRIKYLQTYADGKWSNNLLSLPQC